MSALRRKDKTQSASLTRSRPIWRCNMTAKEYLSQARLLDARINAKIQQVSALNDLATHATATLTGIPRNPSQSESRMAEAVVKIIDLQNEINHDIDELVDLKRRSPAGSNPSPTPSIRSCWRSGTCASCPGRRSPWIWATPSSTSYRLHDWALREFPVPQETVRVRCIE